MNAKIRILSLLVAAVMIFGCLSMTAFATGDEATNAAEALLQTNNHADENADGRCDFCGIYGFNTEKIETAAGVIDIKNAPWAGGINTDETTFKITNYVDTSSRPTTHKYGPWWNIVDNPTNNNDRVLQLHARDNSGATYASHIVFTPETQVEDGDLIVFEYDFYQNSGSKTGVNSFYYYNVYADDTVVSNINAVYTAGSKVDTDGDGTGDTDGVRLLADAKGVYYMPYATWFRVRMVYDNTAKKIYTYISPDGGATFNQCSSVTNYASAESTITQVGFSNKTGFISTMSFDNIRCVKTTAEFLNNTSNDYDCEATYTIKDALAKASEGDLITLVTDVDLTGSYVNVPAGVTLDLNGHNLTAEGVALFNGASIIDSAVNKGSLVVPQGNFATANATYNMLPLWNGEAYILTEVAHNGYLYTAETLDTLGENQIKVYFRPELGDSAATNFVNLLSDGAADNGLSWTVEIDCVKGDAVAQTISFAVPDASIENIYSKYLEDNPPYITLTVSGAGTNFDSYNVRLVIESDCGITYSEAIGIYTPAVAE